MKAVVFEPRMLGFKRVSDGEREEVDVGKTARRMDRVEESKRGMTRIACVHDAYCQKNA